VQDLDLLVAHLVGREVDGRLHRQQAQELEHVVLDEVAQGARVVVVARARADADVLRRGDLDVADVVAVPQRLEQAVGEPERQHVLDGLLAQVVVDPEDLGLVEDREHALVEVGRLGERRAERLLDDDPHLGLVGAREAVAAQCLDDHREVLRRGGEVERAVELLARVVVELVQRAAQAVVHVLVVEGARHVARLVEQRVQDLVVGLAPGELRHGLMGLLAELLVGQLRARDADELEALGQRPVRREVVERRQELAAGQVPRPAEDHERGRVDGQALEARGERVLRLDERHPSALRWVACPPNCARRALSTRPV
jgi:hypothetical protein